MNCHRVQLLLGAFHDDELSPKDHRQVQLHLDGCDECRQQLSALAALSNGFFHYRQQMPTADVENALAKLHARLTTEPRPLTLGERLSFWFDQLLTFHRPLVYAATAATLIVLAAIGFFAMWQPSSNGAKLPAHVRNQATMVESIDYGGRSVFIFQNERTNSTLIWLKPAETEQVPDDGSM